jgi:hypothetical protein
MEQFPTLKIIKINKIALLIPMKIFLKPNNPNLIISK